MFYGMIVAACLGCATSDAWDQFIQNRTDQDQQAIARAQEDAAKAQEDAARAQEQVSDELRQMREDAQEGREQERQRAEEREVNRRVDQNLRDDEGERKSEEK